MPPKPAKQTAAQKRDLKKKEAHEMMKDALSPSAGAEQTEEPEAGSEQQSADVPPTLPEQNTVEIKKCYRKVKALEHKIEIAFEHSQYACPTEIMDNLGRLEDQYGRFRSNVKITVSGAIEAQDCYAEILTICFGERTAVIYKLLRRNMHKEFRHLTREEKATKMLKHDSPILAELKSVSSLIHEFVNERGTPGTWPLSFRDATRLTVERCFHALFFTLRGILETPYSTSVTPPEFRALIRMLEKDVKFLFGTATTGAAKLEVLSKAFDEEGSAISKQKTFILARELFPAKKEMHGKIYELFALDVLDTALSEGLPDWNSSAEGSSAASREESERSASPTIHEPVKTSDRMHAFYSTLKRKRIAKNE